MSTDDWPARPAWHAFAACHGAGLEVFFPPADDPRRHVAQDGYDIARTYCARCPVAAECRDAGAHEHYGMWGGLTPAERRGRHQAA
jgi:hypothetical protein